MVNYRNAGLFRSCFIVRILGFGGFSGVTEVVVSHLKLPISISVGKVLTARCPFVVSDTLGMCP